MTVELTDRIDVPLDAAEKIAEGNDSHVYALGDRVYKEYLRLDLPQVRRYASLVNDGVRALERLSYRGRVEIDKVSYDLDFRGLPIVQVGLGPRDRPLAVSDYAPHPNLDKLTQHPDHFSKYPLERVPPGYHHFYRRLNQVFHEELPTRVQDEFHYHIDMISRLLDRHLRTFGIYIGKYNSKIIPSLESRRLALLVTDLAVYIDRLHYGDATP